MDSNIKWKVLAISLMCCGFLIAAIRPSQRVTEPDKVFQHQNVQDEIYRYLSEFAASQYGVDVTNAGGYDTIYLASKYQGTTLYAPTVTPDTPYLTAAVPLSDSSFQVRITDTAGSGVACDFYWQTMGLR